MATCHFSKEPKGGLHPPNPNNHHTIIVEEDFGQPIILSTLGKTLSYSELYY